MARRSGRTARGTVNRARTGSSRTPTIVAITAVVVLAAVVLGGVWWSSNSAKAAAVSSIPAVTVDASYPVALQGGVILAGRAGAAHTVDLYEDALCPVCRQFEAENGTAVQNALDTGRVQVRYHLVNLLEQRSDPPGYSTLAADAMMCAAENPAGTNNAFPSLHESLYDAQPEEGSAGYTADQLVSLGQRLGAGPGYAACVTNDTHAAAVATNYAQASANPALQQNVGGSTGFGTPTVVVDGQVAPSDTPLAPALGR